MANPRNTPPGGDNRYSYVPFSRLNAEDRERAVRRYVFGDFPDCEYHYPTQCTLVATVFLVFEDRTGGSWGHRYCRECADDVLHHFNTHGSLTVSLMEVSEEEFLIHSVMGR